ncbi:MAG: alpha/beta hydrolase [Myxococcales bacterium]|nr:alpha/beta hydrolase [Myxococcales bacterium]
MSRCLKGNALGDPHVRDVLVYLPPGYDDDDRRYPTLTMLPGFAANHRSIVQWSPWKPNTIERFDAQIAAGESAPAIVVMPDCTTRWGGSQFLDSPATGAYQTYLVEEVVPHVDATFRTLPDARGVVGRSSGGFGALRLALDRPGVFAAIASHAGDAAFEVTMRPMLTHAAIAVGRAGGLEAFAARVVDGGPRDAMEFDAIFMLAASAAYAPEPTAPSPHCAFPVDPATGLVEPDTWARWTAHDPLVRIPTHHDALRALRFAFVDAGDRDEHGLQLAARRLAAALAEAGVRTVHEEHEGGHRGTSWRYEVSLPRLVAELVGG